MAKIISSEVIGTSSFIERRQADDTSKNQGRRDGPLSADNVQEARAINLGTYEVMGGTLTASENNIPKGQVLDHLA